MTKSKYNYTGQNLTAFTVTVSPNKYSEDQIEEDIMRWVRYAQTDADALHNLRLELKAYDRKKSFWTKLKQLFQ